MFCCQKQSTINISKLKSNKRENIHLSLIHIYSTCMPNLITNLLQTKTNEANHKTITEYTV